MTPDELAAYLAGTASTDPADGPGRRLRDALASPEAWADPPGDLLDSILVVIEQERASGTLPDDRAVVSLARAGHRRRRILQWGAGLAAAAAVAVFAILVSRPAAGTEIILASTAQAPGASATAWLRDTSTGLAITLDVRGLPPAPAGSFYQAWMKGPKGTVPIGTFHDRGGDGEVELWSGVSLVDYPILTVTLEREDGDPASSGVVLLRGP